MNYKKNGFLKFVVNIESIQMNLKKLKPYWKVLYRKTSKPVKKLKFANSKKRLIEK